MKSLARPSFFRMFDLLVSTTNPGSKLTQWTHDGVEFERERHSFSGPKHGLTIEIITLTRSGRHGWSLMVTKEYWWAGADSRAFKNLRWARPISGQRSDLLAWLRAQEAALERPLSLTRAPSAVEHRADSVTKSGQGSEAAMNPQGNEPD
jgi:hypothetical protein